MKFEEMRKEIPETPAFIHDMIQDEVKKQVSQSRTVRFRRPIRWTKAKVAAAFLAGIVFTSTTVYAGISLYHISANKTGAYGVTTSVQSSESESEIPEYIPAFTIDSNYIPEGMVWVDAHHLTYADDLYRSGFSFYDALIPNDYLESVKEDTDVIESEEHMFGQYEGIYLKYNAISSEESNPQVIYLLCPDIYRVITINVIDSSLSKEEIFKVIENLTITPTGEMVRAADFSVFGKPYEHSDESYPDSVKDTDFVIHSIGDTQTVLTYAEDTDGNLMNDVPISVRVDSVEIKDDFDCLNPEYIPEKWADALDDEGKLKKSTLSYIRNGDGINRLDEIVRTETVNQKLVYVTLTYTNDSGQDLKHVLHEASMMLLEDKNGGYRNYYPSEVGGSDYDRVTWDGIASPYDFHYSDIHDDYEGGNFIPSLKSGESIQLHFAWVVHEQSLKDMYMKVGNGWYVYNGQLENTDVFDIRQ